MAHVNIIEVVLLLAFLIFSLSITTIRSNIHWILKAVMIVMGLIIIFISSNEYKNSLGWPVKDNFPNHTIALVSSIINEPTPTKEGSIYIWYRDFENNKISGEPRSIVIPYSKAMHKKILNGMDIAKDNGVAIMKNGKKVLNYHVDTHSSDADDIDIIPPESTLPSKD